MAPAAPSSTSPDGFGTLPVAPVDGMMFWRIQSIANIPPMTFPMIHGQYSGMWLYAYKFNDTVSAWEVNTSANYTPAFGDVWLMWNISQQAWIFNYFDQDGKWVNEVPKTDEVSWIKTIEAALTGSYGKSITLDLRGEFVKIIHGKRDPLSGMNEETVIYTPIPSDLPNIINDSNSRLSNLEGFIGYTDSDIYGIEADFENNRFTRLSGAVGRSGGAGFDDIKAFGGRRRCTVLDDGAITSYFGDASYIEDGSMGQVMVYQPKFYYRMVPLKLEPIAGSIGFHIRKARYYISDTPKAGFKVHPAFIKAGTERPYILIGAYEGCLQRGNVYNLTDEQNGNFSPGTGDKLSSIANAKPVSGLTQNLTRRNCGITGENRGTGWSQIYTAIASLTQLLMVIEYCTFNTQDAIGLGAVNKPGGTGNEAEMTGQTAQLGNASGMAQGTNGLVSVTYRGEENPWGNIWKFVDGLNVWGDGTLSGGVPYIADNGFVESVNTGNYQSAGFTMLNAGAFISAFGYGNPDFDWVFIGSEGLGNSALPIGDNHWVTPGLNGFRMVMLSGAWSTGMSAGGFSWHTSHSAATRIRYLSGRLVYVPQAIQGGAL
jgi:hypothetical protein